MKNTSCNLVINVKVIKVTDIHVLQQVYPMTVLKATVVCDFFERERVVLAS